MNVAEPLEKFKTIRPVITKGIGRVFIGRVCGDGELLWIERWLENLVRSKGLPPSCMGANAPSALQRMLAPEDYKATMELIKKEFLLHHPILMEDFSYLTEGLGAYPGLQILPHPVSRSNLI